MQSKLKTRSCPICGSLDHDALYDIPAGMFNRMVQGIEQATIVRCQTCQLQFTNPVLSPQFDEEQYTHEKSGYNKRKVSSIHDIYWSDQELCLNELLSWRNINSMTILDFACGRGGLVYLAQKSGLNIKGIDLNEKGIQVGVRYGVQHLHCTMIQAEPSQHYHIVTALHVLEHLQDCRGVAQEFQRVLKTNGYLVIAVPNFAALSYRMKPTAYWKWPYTHMNALTIDSLDQLCLPYGFKRVCLQGAFMKPSQFGLKLSLSMLMTKYLGNVINFYPTKLFGIYQKTDD